MHREAARLEPAHFRARKLLGSAQYALADLAAAKIALTAALALRPDYADAHCDLGQPHLFTSHHLLQLRCCVRLVLCTSAGALVKSWLSLCLWP